MEYSITIHFMGDDIPVTLQDLDLDMDKWENMTIDEREDAVFNFMDEYVTSGNWEWTDVDG